MRGDYPGDGLLDITEKSVPGFFDAFPPAPLTSFFLELLLGGLAHFLHHAAVDERDDDGLDGAVAVVIAGFPGPVAKNTVEVPGFSQVGGDLASGDFDFS